MLLLNPLMLALYFAATFIRTETGQGPIVDGLEVGVVVVGVVDDGSRLQFPQLQVSGEGLREGGRVVRIGERLLFAQVGVDRRGAVDRFLHRDRSDVHFGRIFL